MSLSREKKYDDEDEAAQNSQQWSIWMHTFFNDWFSGYKSEASSWILCYQEL